jgi:hypothetical protein
MRQVADRIFQMDRFEKRPPGMTLREEKWYTWQYLSARLKISSPFSLADSTRALLTGGQWTAEVVQNSGLG